MSAPFDVVEHKLTVERSKFVAVVRRAATIAEVKALVARRKQAIRKARHHCWACRLADGAGPIAEQARDDGEVGRPGLVLLELLRQRQLVNVVVVVSRVFGGVKLGPGGVSRAFREAGQTAIDAMAASPPPVNR